MFNLERSKMMWIIVMMYSIVKIVASADCSRCQVKMEKGQWIYITHVTPNMTSLEYSWSNDTNHSVATNQQPSVSPVKYSSDWMLVSDHYHGKLTLRRHYVKKNGKLDFDDIPCCGNPHNDPEHLDISPTPSPNNPGGHPYSWIIPAVVTLCVTAAAAAVIGFIYKKKKKKKAFFKVPNEP